VPEPNSTRANDRLQRLGRLTLKELREILRDRRTIVTLVLMPLFMYPVLSIAFQQFIVSHQAANTTPVYTIGFQDWPEARVLREVLAQGGVDVVDIKSEEAQNRVSGSAPVVQAGIHPQLEELLREYKIDVGLRLITPQPDLPIDPGEDITVDIELLYLRRSGVGADAARFVEEHLAAASEKLLGARLERLKVTQRPVPVRSFRRGIDQSDEAALSSIVSLKSVVPFILILMTVTGAVYPAIDLTAGERERGTLEVLMAAPIPRIGILLAKYVTVLAVALLTAVANLFTMTVTIAVTGLGEALFGEAGFSSGVMAAIFGLLILFAAFFSAVLLVITSTARSFKEAQAYLIPLMIVSLAPGMLSLVPGVELEGIFLVTPLANIVLLGRDLLAFKATGPATLIVVASTLLYAAAAIGVAARIFGAESVLYSTQRGWSDVFRRPREPQVAPTATAAWICLTVMIPAYFLFINWIGRAGDNIVVQQILGVVMTIAVFGAIPLAACQARRVPVGPAFRMPHNALAVLLAVAVLGSSFWTLSHETVLAIRHLRGVEIDPQFIAAASEYVEKLRTLPAAVVVVSMALVPAFFEESFFRGFLFAALRSRMTATATIFVTALVFGAFHWMSPSSLASERFVSSTVMGVLLGWVRWRTNSLLPGIVLHAFHNALLILLAYFEPQLTAAGFGVSETEHLPVAWLVAGSVAVAVGLAGLWPATGGSSECKSASRVERQ
jgi:ABC-2 type transport system permease protein/sodium transport system permease protein